MAELTLFTIIIELLPPLIITLIYTLLFGEKRNQYIEAFIGLMYINSILFFLFNSWYLDPYVTSGFQDSVFGSDLFFVIFTNFMFHIGYSLQTFFVWIMVSFVAVLFGQLVIMLKLALQDPLKMKFSNLIKRITKKEPVSDGYSGLRDRLDNIKFEGVEPQPLNPEVVRKAWNESWRDYLLIGLVTIVPSIGLYMDVSVNPYAYGILVFLTWIYRFGYPASNRIAKGAGTMLGNRDIGSEMMRGVLGWFFRLNILLSILTIGIDFSGAFFAGTVSVLVNQYLIGLVIAFVPILYAILLLPLAEDFSVVLYKRVFEKVSSPKKSLRGTNWKNAFKNLGASIVSSGLVIGAFVGSVLAVTVNFAVTHGMGFSPFPGQIDSTVASWIFNAPNNGALISPIVWSLMMLLIPLGMMLFLGVLGSYLRQRVKGGVEGFSFISGAIVSIAVWFLLPGRDYIMGLIPTPVRFGGAFFHYLRPILTPPSGDILMRIIYTFVFELGVFVSVVLFIQYYFHFKNTWEEEIGVEAAPLVAVTSRDIRDTVGLFVAGIVGSVVGVVILSLFIDPFNLFWTIFNLIAEIGNPDGLELVLASNVSYFAIVAEHNIIRTFLMLVAGPLFWMLVLWFVAVQKKSKSDKMIGWVAILCTLVVGAASFIWTFLDMQAGVFIPANEFIDPSWPWTYAAQLGLRAAILYGILFGLYLLIFAANKLGRGSAGGWWLPPLMTFFAIEYFIYDDQFTIIAIVILPMILAIFYKLFWGGKEVSADEEPQPSVVEVRAEESEDGSEWSNSSDLESSSNNQGYSKSTPRKQEDFLLIYIRMGLISLAVAEILSTALWVAGIGTVIAMTGGNALLYVIELLPHGLIEIPTFLFAAAASLRIARDMDNTIISEDWDNLTQKTKSLLTDRRIWRTFAVVMFFLLIAALIEEHITWIIVAMFNMFI
ncbi:MAG: stage II sporulation protein M [Candidatus Thorarchaeota archaeon]|nr:stage II sporulation protein M [Candidatus Thorarchaeota archaeon]